MIFPPGRILSGRAAGLGPGLALHGFHKVAHLLLGADISFGEKLVISGLHCDFADLQILGQGPLGGELFIRPQRAGQDILPDTAVQSLVKGHAGGFFQFIG